MYNFSQKGVMVLAGKALLVIDMLNDFVREGGALYVGEPARAIIPVVAGAIREARGNGKPVIYLCDQHRSGDQEFQLFPPHCLAGSEGGQVCSELTPEPGDLVIPKRRFSGFYGTDLDLYLRELDIREVELTGVCTNICVLYTAADARMRGYRVAVRGDGVASFDREAHHFALQEMEHTLGVRVV